MSLQVPPLPQQDSVRPPRAFAGQGTSGEPFEDVRSIAVLRGGGLGDLLFAVPALDALAAAYPEASLTLLGTPMHRTLLDGRGTVVDSVEILPYAQGVRDRPRRQVLVAGAGNAGAASGSTAPPAEEAPEFLARMREQHFDLAVQLHGGGRYSNPFLLALGARHTVGCTTPDAQPLERNVPYAYYQHEMMRWLEVADLAGAPPVRLEPDLPVTAAEQQAARDWLVPGTKGLVSLHPGATDPRRRWPEQKFAAVAARLVDDGYQVLVVGDDSEAALAEELVRLGRELTETPGGAALLSTAAGQLDLPTLTGVLSISRVLVGNDSGPRHLAQAVGTRTASIYWCANVINAGALGRSLHRIQIGWILNCPECGISVTGEDAIRCSHDCSFVADVPVEGMYRDVSALLAG
jgi:ADP-heptose:LPS heptosyltransferase